MGIKFIKKIFNMISIVIFLFFLIYIIYLFVYNRNINIINFYLITFFSHIFFLVIIPLEGLFVVKVKHLILNPYIFIIILAFVADLSLLVNYYIGKNIDTEFLKNFIGKRRFNGYIKKYDKYGIYVLLLSTSTPFLPGPVFALIEGMLHRNYKRVLFLGFIGLLIKWSIFYFFSSSIV